MIHDVRRIEMAAETFLEAIAEARLEILEVLAVAEIQWLKKSRY